MHIERAHGTTQQSAIKTIDQFLDKLVKRQFREVKIQDPEKSWSGNKMTFSFTVKRGFKWTTIRGTITVDADRVSLDGELGFIARQFVSDEEITRALNQQFDKLFGAKK